MFIIGGAELRPVLPAVAARAQRSALDSLYATSGIQPVANGLYFVTEWDAR